MKNYITVLILSGNKKNNAVFFLQCFDLLQFV